MLVPFAALRVPAHKVAEHAPALVGIGFVPQVVADVDEVLDLGPGRLMVTVWAPDELSCSVVSEVRFRRPGAVVVALVPGPTPALVRHAHDCGAHKVADPDGAPVPLAADLRAFSDELGGRSVDRELLVRELGLSTDEVLWLGLLANNAGLDGVARSTGHSSRTMARLLHELYSKMEVDGWRAAVRQARSLGLLG